VPPPLAGAWMMRVRVEVEVEVFPSPERDSVVKTKPGIEGALGETARVGHSCRRRDGRT